MPAGGLRPVYASGECEIDLARRELRVQGAAVPIGGRAFEVIEVLAQSAGELVTKDELMNCVWPGAIVSDNALQMHISAARKALGSYRGMLKTESGRGYRLLGDWAIRHSSPTRSSSVIPFPQSGSAIASPRLGDPEEAPEGNFPVLVTDIVGRSAALPLIRELLSAYRVVTLTGPGGIGKTTLALHAARCVLEEFADGGWLVELASLSDPELVPSAVTGALGLNLGGGEITAAAIARAISDKNLLLLLDNCEHIIDAAANLTEVLLQSCRHVTILVTSRETLRINGEYVYRVGPLEVPAAEDEPDHMLRRSAVELFVARARESGLEAIPRADELSSVAAICRHLDGIPLAIELAAARAATFGVGQVAAGLADRFAVLTSNRRTILPRHRTLRATLDWSYDLLDDTESWLLRNLAVFPAGFSLDAAAAVMDGAERHQLAMLDGIANLVDKSLVVFEKSEATGRWRLLETTRAYARDKLAERGEAGQALRRHAEFYLALFAPFAADGQLQAALDDLGRYRREIDNLRAALNWAFSPSGDAALGIELAAGAANFWIAASLLAEAREWAGKAVARIGDAAGTPAEMILQCSLGMTLIYTRGMIAPARTVLMRALTLAQELGDFDYQQRAFHGLWLFSARSMAMNDALSYARQYEELARDRDPHAKATADWLIGHTQFYLGEHRAASARLRQAISEYPIESRRRDMIRLVNDLRASAFGHLSASLLSLGLLDAAAQMATNAVEEAHGTNQPIVLCIALAWESGLVCLTLGDLETAERYGEELIDHAYKHGLRPFHAAGLCVRGSLAARRGNPESGLDPLRRGLTEMREASYLLFYPVFLAELAAALAASGRIDESLTEIDGALRFVEETNCRWFIPEILRTKGEILLRKAADRSAPSAEDCLNQAAEMARVQGALFWELRIALSLARLRVAQSRPDEARQTLAPVYDRFTEGFETADLLAAKQLLDEVAAAGPA
ncbi:MAG TPA: winged helix-turn-helix domain-containing protein [Xanthobacteraceae bacterium]|nr:winged helix-turn-helix domain-containing protein [Xanthobacteraceae bacterium]